MNGTYLNMILNLTEIRFRDGRELDVFTCIMIHFDAFGSQKTVKRSVIQYTDIVYTDFV